MVYRAGVTNAADRGLDMWTNFGPAVQVKHRPLTAALCDDVMEAVPGGNVIIFCKELPAGVARAALVARHRPRLLGVFTEEDIVQSYGEIIGRGRGEAEQIRDRLLREFQEEFPVCDPTAFEHFMLERHYSSECLAGTAWTV
jgi:type II restriction enzyme